MTNFTPGETLTADDLNAAFASVTPPDSPLLGGTGSSYAQVAVGSGLSLSGGTLTSTGGTLVSVVGGDNIDISGLGTVTIAVAPSPQFDAVVSSAPLGVVGAGTTISATDHPGNLTVMQTDSGDTILDLVSFSGNAVFSTERANGSSGAPTVVQTNDTLGGIRAGGYYGAGWGGGQYQAGVLFRATETWSFSSRAAELSLWATPSGSNIAHQYVLLTADGHLLAGTAIDDGSGAPLQAPSASIAGLLSSGTLALGDITPFSHIGSGLTSSGGTLSATGGGGGGSVTKVSTAAPIAGGDITTTGTISLNSGAGLHVTSGTLLADWNAGSVTAIGSGINLSGGTLAAPGAAGTVTRVVAGSGLAGGTITTTGTISLGTIAATTLMGNATASAAVPGAVTVGTGLALPTSGTLNAQWGGGTVSALGTGISLVSGTLSATGSGGSVTSVVAGAGLNGGTITTSGTLSANWQAGTVTAVGSDLAINSGTIDITTIAATSLFGNSATTAAKPTAVAIGSGLSLSTAGTLSATGGSGSVTSVATSGAGISGGPITTTGTLTVEWNAGTVSALGTGLTLTSGTLTASGGGSSTLTPNIQTASYTIQATDVGKLVIFNSTSAVTATYPSLATIGANGVVDISNINTGVVTVTVGAANGTIDAGGTSYFLGQNQFSRQTNNGTNWATERGLGAVTMGAGGGYGFGTGNTVGASGVPGILGSSNNVNNSNFAVGISNVATTNSGGVVIGNSAVVAATDALLIGNTSTLSGSNNLMIANSSSNSASNPFPGFGLNLAITGSGGGVAAGNSITASGTISFPYGYQANDHGNAFFHGRGQGGPAASSTAPTQREEYTFWNINHGTVAVSLSNNGSTPASITVGNPGTKTAGFVRCHMLIVDRANGNAVTYYTSSPGVFSKGTTAASMTVNATLTAGGTLGSGLALAAAPTLAADTTNGGFSVGYTPPVGNTDTLWAVAWLDPFVAPGIA